LDNCRSRYQCVGYEQSVAQAVFCQQPNRFFAYPNIHRNQDKAFYELFNCPLFAFVSTSDQQFHVGNSTHPYHPLPFLTCQPFDRFFLPTGHIDQNIGIHQ